MTTNNLLNEIVHNYGKLTKAEKKVADFVLANPQRALNASITDLAELCKVGDTSVFRFCRSLHLKGYQDFRVSLAMSTNSDETLDTGAIYNGFESENMEQLIDSVYAAYTAALEDTVHSLNHDAIQQAVEILLRAQHIHLFGLGASGITAMETKNKFLRVTPNVSYHADNHEQITAASLLAQDCAALIFSNSGITKDCIQMAKLAKSGGAKVIFVTKFAKTPAGVYADVVLVSGAMEGPLQGGSIAGKLAQMFLMDVLYTEYFRRLGDVAAANKKRTAQAVAEKML